MHSVPGQRAGGEPVADQRTELHGVARAQRDDPAGPPGAEAVAALVEPRGLQRDALDLADWPQAGEDLLDPLVVARVVVHAERPPPGGAERQRVALGRDQ